MTKPKGIMEKVPCTVCEETGISVAMIRGSRIERQCSHCKGKKYIVRKK